MSAIGREHVRREALLGADPMWLQGAQRPLVSFEFFPPKTEEMEAKLWQAVKRLEPLAPRFVSVTYGAGGSTRERTHATVVRIRRETPLEPAAHLTCVGAARKEIDAVAEHYWEAGIREYWLVDARKEPLVFDILRHTPKGYRTTPKKDSWMKSNVFGKSVCLIQGTNEFGDPEYTLEVR